MYLSRAFPSLRVAVRQARLSDPGHTTDGRYETELAHPPGGRVRPPQHGIAFALFRARLSQSSQARGAVFKPRRIFSPRPHEVARDLHHIPEVGNAIPDEASRRSGAAPCPEIAAAYGSPGGVERNVSRCEVHP